MYPWHRRSDSDIQPKKCRIGKTAVSALMVGGLLVVAAPIAGASKNADQPRTSANSTISVAVETAPVSLDPAKSGNSADSLMYMALAYEPLINLGGNGALQPGLATSWKYIGSSLKTFELTLGKNIRFSDGELLTPADVVASIQHEKTSNGSVSAYADEIASATVSGPDAVTLHFVDPTPDAGYLLTGRFLVGYIVGPKGLKDPSSLGTTTDGAGEYKVDPSESVSGSYYTFVPNPYYSNQSAIHFSKFVVKVITNPETQVNALESGQVAYITDAYPSAAPQAASEGLKVYSTIASYYGVFLFDRNGTIVPALKSQLVREALNYATNREAITNAVFGKYGVENDEVSLPGYVGYDPNYKNHYTYDPAKAKKLLAEAGYPHGFTMTIGGAVAWADSLEMDQAIASEWAQIGVTVKIDSFSSITAMLGPWQDKKLAAISGNNDGKPMYIEAGELLTANAGLFNPLSTSNAVLTQLINKAYATQGEAASVAAWQAVQREVVNLGWFVPIASGSYLYFANKDLKGIALSPTSFRTEPDIV